MHLLLGQPGGVFKGLADILVLEVRIAVEDLLERGPVGDVVVVTYSERADGVIRIVSARPATPAETRRFEAFRRGRK